MLYTLKKVTPEVLVKIEEEKNIRKSKEIFLLFSLGSQFDHLIKQEVEKLGVFCLVADPASVIAEDVRKVKPIGIILSGGPASVYDKAPPFDEKIFNLKIPVLGICLGFQLWAKYLGINVIPATKREFGIHQLNILKADSLILQGCQQANKVLQSHGDTIEPDSRLEIIAKTENAPVAAAHYKNLWGVQFHPEVTETECGSKIFSNFCFEICKAKDKYPAAKVAQQKIAQLKEQIGDKKVLLALSGGTDSSIVAYLLKHALKGKKGQIRAVYIKGIDRPDDENHVLEFFDNHDWLELEIIDATDDFLKALKGKKLMAEKRQVMSNVYKSILKKKAQEFNASFIAQGTLYADISESGGGYSSGAQKAVIKEHHNTNLNFDCQELTPLADCVKDSGRSIGREIGVPEDLLIRHPFPGPGLIVRIEGEITRKKLSIIRRIDKIYIEELRNWDLYKKVWQAGAVITQSVTTWTKGDDAGSGMVVVLWAIWSANVFTARAVEFPWDFLKHVSRRITNEIREIGAVTYRISDKPPSTIEWG